LTKTLDNLSEKREAKKRELSAAMCSRWYRAPEIVLLDKNYN